MPNTAAAPNEADAPRPWARAILHARIPAALKLLLLALLAALSKAAAPGHTLRSLRQDWFFSANTSPDEDPDSVLDFYTLRRVRRLRARLGWLLRCAPNEGMSLSGHRAPAPRPERAARAPPLAALRPIHPESVPKTPPRPAMTQA